MSYQVIARKYRPQRFADVVGQDHVTQTLVNAIRQNRIAHAYLFVGPRGTGKTTLARIFAKCLNCTGGPKVDFPDNDPRCQEITDGRSLDVLEIDGASNRGIEEIRELRETVKYAPASSKFKIYIIDEVHMLTKEAFNALLKTLEEPPAHVKFMFATTEPEKVLATILSRCQRFDLRRIPAALIVKHLAYISQLEKVKIDEAALYAIARGADGCMRDAESTLDQLISFCGEKIVEPDVLSMFGLAARNQVLALAGAMIDGDAPGTLRQLNDLSKGGKDLGRLLADLLNHFRNLLLFQLSGGDLSLLEISEQEAASLSEQSGGIPSDGLTRVLEVLTDAERKVRDAASKKIMLEVGLLKAIEAKNAVPIDVVLSRLQQMQVKSPTNRGQDVIPAIPVASSPAPVRATPNISTSAAAASGSADLPTPPLSRSDSPNELLQLWKNVIDAVGRVSPFARTYLLEAHPVSFSKNLLTIGFDPEFSDHVGLVDNPKNRTLIQTKLHELGCGDVQVKFVVANVPADWVRPSTESANSGTNTQSEKPRPRGEAEPLPAKPETKALTKDDFKNDPLIKQALEIFKGTIVEVRA